MNRTTKFLMAGLIAVVVIVGLLALNLSGGAAFAQSPTATPTAPGGPGHGGPGRGPAFGRPGGVDMVSAVAQALGMTTQDLMTQLRAGKTLADLAQSKGVSQDAVKQAIANAQKAAVDAAVTAGRLTADQATQAKQRIDQEIAALDLTRPGFGFGFGRVPQPGGPPQPNQGVPRPDFGGRGPGFGGAAVPTAIAQALGMTAQDLMTQLRAGKTLADLAQSKGVSQDAVKQAIANAEKAEVDAAVTAGRLTADQATQAKQRIDERVAALDLTKPGLGFGRGFEFHRAPGTMPTTPNGTTPNNPNGRPTMPFRGRPGPNAPAAPTAPSGTSL